MTVKNFLELVEIKAKIASVWPFLLGLIFVAFNYNHVNWDVTGVFFVAMFLFNMAVDINDNYQDYRHAGTQAERWKRETNIIGVQHLRMARVFGLMATFVVIAGALGLWLVWVTGWPLLIMGVGCFLVGYLYAGGPRPLSGTPTGEFFAGFTMGYLITLITVYLNVYQRGGLSWPLAGRVLLASGIAVTAIAALLLANNICDAKEDLALNRRTIVYYLGKRGSLILFAAFYIVGYLALVGSVAVGDLPKWSLLALLGIPLIYRNVRAFFAVQVKKQTFILAVRNLAILAATTVLAEVIGLFFG
ncbi:1,4-dihydroxy-2-naphthoate polyprenyltransferase [Levilactobacillus humaensis]|uniref:1,4-dihydroxy-2-naphthoate polyprenyltransferase n=1 Tax=Levilactobacillus humaensis TaxID=2950375 RepID=UPI0021C2C154|nr:1,4-dihydroxy-2-naphthoate polyprenyltransferase [Levilactobacillus humaensis]